MRRTAAGGVALALLLAGCTGAGRGGDAGPPVGAAARAKHGADPVAAPPPGVGEAEDPPANGAAPH